MTHVVLPHGGALVDAFVGDEEAKAISRTADSLPSLTLDSTELADLEMIANGAFSPLKGFLGYHDYRSVLDRFRLADDTVWPLPITLAVPEPRARELRTGSTIALRETTGRLWGTIQANELYERDPVAEARLAFGTDDCSHPGVAYSLSRSRHLIAGPVRVLPLPKRLPFHQYRWSPRRMREEIAVRGWTQIAGFQTRNPIHRAHEHLTKMALELVDGLVLHPLVGQTVPSDVPAGVRMRCYQTLLERYYPKERTILAVYPAAMRYAGPREALLHALVRKNYGINRLIVGRDHAGVGRFYGPFDSQRIFDKFTSEEIGVQPLRLDATFFCLLCDSTTSARACPHDDKAHVDLSGSRIREILVSGGFLPREFSRPEVAEILREHYEVHLTNEPDKERALKRSRGRKSQGYVVWLTGLSGAGKTTLARAMERSFTSRRSIEVLDGDEMRTHLCKGLGFSRDDRDTNVSRIGVVARLLARNGVAVIVAAISPYVAAREEQRRLADEEGLTFIEIFLDASLSALIERDAKGLYRRAMAGEIPHFTGVSDPYEPPQNPELILRTDQLSVEECIQQIQDLLRGRGLGMAKNLAA